MLSSLPRSKELKMMEELAQINQKMYEEMVLAGRTECLLKVFRKFPSIPRREGSVANLKTEVGHLGISNCVLVGCLVGRR